MLEIRAIYGLHDAACTCAGCQSEHIILSDFSTKFVKIDPSIIDDYASKVYNQIIGVTDIHEKLWIEHFTRFRSFAAAGYGRKFTDAANYAEFTKFQQIQQNLSHFAAHKQQALTEELRRIMVDKAGNKLPFIDYKKQAADILRLHNTTYLRTELTSATQVGQAVESWQEFEKRAFLYPNLRYDTAGDDRVRPKHVLLDGAIHPVNDPFWNTHYPPNGWRCRCKVVQTDTEANGKIANFQPDKGFRQNAGKTGKIFGDDHPYFDVSTLDAEKVQRQANTFLEKLDKEAAKKLAIARHANEQFTLPALPAPIRLTQGMIEQVVKGPHELAAVRNNIMTAFNYIVPELKAAGATPISDPLNPKWTKYIHYLVELVGGEFYFNIKEIDIGEGLTMYQLHSITDNI